MTNREKINNLDNQAFIKMIKKMVNVPGFEYVDWDAYLSSSQRKLPYKGVPGYFKTHGKDMEEIAGKAVVRKCLVLGDFTLYGKRYTNIIDDKGKFAACPAELVKKDSELKKKN